METYRTLKCDREGKAAKKRVYDECYTWRATTDLGGKICSIAGSEVEVRGDEHNKEAQKHKLVLDSRWSNGPFRPIEPVPYCIVSRLFPLSAVLLTMFHPYLYNALFRAFLVEPKK